MLDAAQAGRAPRDHRQPRKRGASRSEVAFLEGPSDVRRLANRVREILDA